MTKNKIAFAGFMGAILMSIGAANADIATTTYVQGGVQAAKGYTDTQVGALTGLNTTAKTNAVAAINEVNTAVNTVAGNIVTDGDDAQAYETSTTKYPSMAVMNTSIASAVDGINDELGALALEDTINTDFIDDKAVTKAKLSDAVQASLDKADAALPAATYNTQVGTVNKTNMGTTTAETVVGGIKEAMDAAAAAKQAADNAASTASANYALKTEVSAIDTAYKAADKGINDKIGTGFDATNTVAKAVADAKTAATTAETNAKAYADGLASNYATAAQGAKADAALPAATYNTQVGTVNKTNMGTTTAETVVGGIKEAMDAAKAAKQAADNAASTASTNYALKTDVGTVSTLTTTAKGNVVAAINELDADIAAMDTAYKAADTAINNKIGTGFDATNTVAKAITDANAEITTINNSDVMKSGATKTKIDQIATNATNITNITKNGGTIDTKISAAVSTLNTSLDGKIDEATDLAGKTLTTDATTGQLKDAASVAGTKPTDCDAANSGCSYMLMSTGSGFTWTKIVDTYK